MPSKDLYHDVVKRALVADGWTITHDPFVVPFGQHNLFVDLGAEAPIAAEKGARKIAVEVKSFASPSAVAALEQAVGQYVLYDGVLEQADPERALYLAVPLAVHAGIFAAPLGQLVVRRERLRLVVFDPATEVVTQWIE